MKILDSTISTRSEVIVGNIHPSNVENVDHLNNSFINPGSPLDRSTPISDYDIAETEIGSSTLENSPIQAMEVAEVVQEKESVVDKRPKNNQAHSTSSQELPVSTNDICSLKLGM